MPLDAQAIHFQRYGRGNVIYNLLPDGRPSWPPSNFEWGGTFVQPNWFACPAANGMSQIKKRLWSYQNMTGCWEVMLAALDWAGTRPW